jgi:hypothetical protein
MAPLAALVSVLVVAASPASAGQFAVRVVSDMAQCPAPSQVESALRQVLGEGEQAASGWTLWYGRDPAAAAPEREAGLIMELADPTGERLVSRRIPTPAGDCEAIGTAMAAVVERSLRDLGWTRGEPLPESAGPSRPARAPAAKTAAATTEKPAPSADATGRKRVPRLVLGAGPVFGTSSRLGTNLLVDARVRVAGPFCLRLGAAALAGSASESVPSAGNGQVSLSSRTFTLSALAAFVAGRVELAGGPVVWLAADQASSSDLPRVASGTRVVVAAGIGIGVALPVSQRWRVGLDLEGVRVAFAPDTYVDWNGTRTMVLAPSPWQGMAAVKLEFLPWP